MSSPCAAVERHRDIDGPAEIGAVAGELEVVGARAAREGEIFRAAPGEIGQRVGIEVGPGRTAEDRVVGVGGQVDDEGVGTGAEIGVDRRGDRRAQRPTGEVGGREVGDERVGPGAADHVPVQGVHRGGRPAGQCRPGSDRVGQTLGGVLGDRDGPVTGGDRERRRSIESTDVHTGGRVGPRHRYERAEHAENTERRCAQSASSPASHVPPSRFARRAYSGAPCDVHPMGMTSRPQAKLPRKRPSRWINLPSA